MSIQNSAVLVSVSLKKFGTERKDKAASAALAVDKLASERACKAVKSLLPDNPWLADIASVDGAIRSVVTQYTLAWDDNGQRLLPNKNYVEFLDRINKLKQTRESLVRGFVADYPQAVKDAATSLGALYNPDDYPDAADIEQEFQIRVITTPLPESKDFRIDAENAIVEELKQQYDALIVERVADVQRQAWEKLRTCVERLADRLADADDGSHKIFRGPMIEEAQDLMRLLRGFNVTNDPMLESAAQGLEAALAGRSTEHMRSSVAARHQVQAAAQEVLDKFNF